MPRSTRVCTMQKFIVSDNHHDALKSKVSARQHISTIVKKTSVLATWQHMPRRSKMRSLRTDGFTWWQQQSFYVTTDWSRHFQKYKTEYKEWSALAGLKQLTLLDNWKKDLLAMSCYNDLSLFCSECTLYWQLLIIKSTINCFQKQMYLNQYFSLLLSFFLMSKNN